MSLTRVLISTRRSLRGSQSLLIKRIHQSALFSVLAIVVLQSHGKDARADPCKFCLPAGPAAIFYSRRATNQALESEAIPGAAAQRWPNLLDALASLRLHWPEYLMEAGELGTYMFLTSVLATLLRHPASPVSHLVMGELARRLLIGLVTGAIVIAIVLTPWGKQSGGHFNPAITLTFYRLGKVETWDTVFYSVAQFASAVAGVALALYLFRGAPAHDQVRYAMTVPGRFGTLVAFLAELAISFVLMMTILYTTNHGALARFTPYLVGAQYALYITFETPLSGMSMNPARTFGPAFHAGCWHSLWIYFVAPTLGMLAAAEVFLRCRKGVRPSCAKLYHAPDKRCIFRDCCSYTKLCEGAIP